MILRVEIEDELAAQTEGAAKAQGLRFNDFIVAALRAAIAQTRFSTPPVFTQKVHDFGAHVESPWSLLADLETNAGLQSK